ncbi:GSCOCG00005516001-RA-CDS [Cotesia congregata]|uniref:Similar to CG4743: S-adenosylmethionine mitochondrial carrier protein homolog (Drosophila melanogaster) n=1 Tax=Cotesia congregata TaxID=51543 RepID=A0A8J2MII8_COTCN|nr:GSCOCG00005516001-RA-CDS [Cotesia congregata]CAG5093555.1 Similar to CG4743: S-adenosylmethionine mitochondrial carrier protein homolog (Drosophila melanogaster) [Cotesia congregata]
MSEETKKMEPSRRNIFWSSMISGAAAGLAYDVIFFPMETVKTRLQSKQGFINSGGFKKLYRGLGPAIAGSAPSASLFFATYDGFKEIVQPYVEPKNYPFVHMGGACAAELMACLVKVPVEVLKQRRQALLTDAYPAILGIRTLYRGYGITLLRDLPFGIFQMPLWDFLKLSWKNKMQRDCTPLEGAIAGAFAGSTSAALTTPFDVIKTRIMLSHISQKRVKISDTMREVYTEKGIRGLFTGISLRTFGFGLSSLIFFGVYEQTKYLCSIYLFRESPRL